MIFYPLVQIRTNNQKLHEIIELWQQYGDKCEGKGACFGIYRNYDSNSQSDYDFIIATETPNDSGLAPIEVDDSLWFETFPTTIPLISDTWQQIWNKEKQGLLKRAYTLDFEKYGADGKVEIFISIQAHC